ncbi:hypothetical protein Rhopal_003829-T1 [Rhodotorula paludigena]|uniref:GATA-type domain-containing protein n=1 Tax=Rhodotorula paludigena TaxID=86838 RepID=A0AAV5GE68_9BASI|nr:hypothetical protein Rhopal_003829-T1 [Rhodotorula paludigena]
MQAEQGLQADHDFDFAAFVDLSGGADPRSPSSAAPSPPAAAASAATAQQHAPHAQGSHAARTDSTPSASTASGDSPGVSDPTSSPFPLAETALTSASTSPPFPQAGFQYMDPAGGAGKPEGKLHDAYEHFAAAWAAQQQQQAQQTAAAAHFHPDHAAAQQAAAIAAAAAGHPLSIPSSSAVSTPLPVPLGTSFPQSLPPLMQQAHTPVSSSFSSQLPAEWIQAANLASSTYGGAPALALPGFPQLPPVPYPQPQPTFNHLGQLVANPAMDHNLYALHMSLEAQARAMSMAGSLPGSPAGFEQLPVLPPASGPSSPARPAKSTAPKRKGSKSSKAAGSAASGSDSLHQRAMANASQHTSPLPSPGVLPPPDMAAMYGYLTQTHQRPLPPLPPARGDTASASSSAIASPASSSQPGFSGPPPSFPYYASASASSAAPSREESPRASGASAQPPVVDYDFSSLEQDLDRFSSLGGFASAAAAAMASVGPSSATGAGPTTAGSSSGAGRGQSSKPSDVYGIGGYGGSSTPRIEPGQLPSPKVVADVLNDSIFFPHPSSSGSNKASPATSASAGTGYGGGAGSANGASPAAQRSSTTGLSPAAAAGAGDSPLAPSPAGSTIIDEEGAEVLSRKDPIAAQVWRMFHKAKNTMPNGARMENLTWRLMSMTLKKRREDSTGASATGSAAVSAAPSAAPSPGTEEARIQRAMEAALEEQREENEAKEEGRDTVQPLGGPSNGRARGGGRARSDSGSAARREAAASSGRDEDDVEEERGRRRRTKSGNKSASATPESEEDGVSMDWRAMSKSRSRSRAPDMMDWRAQSRSRSRAPDFRVSVAPPTIDATPAVANFSRFFADSGLPSPVHESAPEASNDMPPPPVPSSSHPPVSAADSGPLAIPLPDDNAAALAELATSLGLSPQDQAELFGSATARLDGHSLLDLPSPGGMASPLPLHQQLGSPLGPGLTSPLATSSSQQFSFPVQTQSPDGSGPDPNLAAIESTLNQLISLQTLASPPAGATPVPLPGTSVSAAPSSYTSPAAAKSPLSTSFTASTTPGTSNEQTPQPSTQHSRQSSASGSITGGKGSQAQQQLQQFISGRKAGPSGLSSSASASSSRRVSASSSSPYLNATTLAQSSRPFSFGAAASVAAAAATSTSPPSGLSLARPAHITPQSSQPTTPYSESPVNHFFTGSAPAQPSALVGSPNPPLFGSNTDTTHLLYDYFHAQHNPSPYLPSPYLGQTPLEVFGSAPTSVDPSQLLNHSAAATPYGSPGSSSWGPSPAGDTPGASLSVSPDEYKSMAKPRRPSAARSHSAGQVSTLSKSAPVSRVHSRSNTISLPSTIEEGKALDLSVSDDQPEDGASAGKGKASTSGGGAKKVEADGSPTKCLNCSTTNTPLWRRDAEGRPLCNACGLFRNLHGVDRPANLNTGVIKKRNRNRAPKDGTGKKAGGRAAARRNSAASASGESSSLSRKERAGANAPYPSAAARAQQQQGQE